jgi:hypothetical protein
VEGAEALMDYLRENLRQILENLSLQEVKVHQELDREFIFQLLVLLNKLETIVAS